MLLPECYDNYNDDELRRMLASMSDYVESHPTKADVSQLDE